MATDISGYAARLEVDYPAESDRVKTLFRVILIIPIAIVLAVLSGEGSRWAMTDSGEWVQTSSAGISGGLFLATLLMLLLVTDKYPPFRLS
jgi:hypothetical protein